VTKTYLIKKAFHQFAAWHAEIQRPGEVTRRIYRSGREKEYYKGEVSKCCRRVFTVKRQRKRQNYLPKGLEEEGRFEQS